MPGPAPARLLSVNIGRVETRLSFGQPRATAIAKRPVAGQVRIVAHDDEPGLEGDQIGNRKHHGGPLQAVYAYATEDAEWWAKRLAGELLVPDVDPRAPGAFGENLTTEGVDVTGAIIGERWRVGTALLEVTTYRQPCATFAGYWSVPDLIGRFIAAGRVGAYLRVVEPGIVRAGDPVTVVDRPDAGQPVREAFRERNRGAGPFTW